MLEAIYYKGQNIVLEDGTTIQLLERWDTKVTRKNYVSDEVTWKVSRVNDRDDIFVIKESEIPEQSI